MWKCVVGWQRLNYGKTTWKRNPLPFSSIRGHPSVRVSWHCHNLIKSDYKESLRPKREDDEIHVDNWSTVVTAFLGSCLSWLMFLISIFPRRNSQADGYLQNKMQRNQESENSCQVENSQPWNKCVDTFNGPKIDFKRDLCQWYKRFRSAVHIVIQKGGKHL